MRATLFDQARQVGGGWRELAGAKKQTYTYPWLSIDPVSGRVFMAGPQATRYLSTAEAGKKSLEFVLAGPGKPLTTIPCAHASDGAMLLTAYLALAYSEQPGMLLIEEPENGLHPSRLQAVVGGAMAFLSFGSNHHDLALLEAPQAAPADPGCAGLVHVALRIGDDIETLRAVRARLRALGVPLHHARDHEVSQSLYLQDPDGLVIEVYVDADPAVWAARPEAVATVRPLQVDWLD